MTEKSNPEEPPQLPGINFIVPMADLINIGLNDALGDTVSIDCFDINRRLTDLAAQRPASQSGGLFLLVSLTSYHFDPDHKTEPFRPMWTMGDRRSLVPTDLQKEQIDVIAEFVSTVDNPGLRSRLADVSWFMQRSRHEMADTEINGYCDCVEAVRAGNRQFSHDDNSAWGVSSKELLVRAASISHATRWKLPASDRVRALISDLVETAHREGRSDDFWRIAELDLDHAITPAQEVAASAEELAGSLGENPEARLRLLKLAARAHRKNRCAEGNNRCLAASAECHVQKADIADSPMLEATFLQHAIEVLRNLPGTKDRRNELTARLRAVQPNIRDEMAQISTEIDLTEIVEHSVATVHGRSWPTAFLSLILCDQPPIPHQLQDAAREYARKHPLQAIMPTQVHDFQGRVVFRSPGMLRDLARIMHRRLAGVDQASDPA